MRLIGSLFAFVAFMTVSGAMADVTPGDKAPDFTLTDSNGKTVSLSDYAGETVVLEWTNHDCPFVRKHYNAGNMQATQRAVTEDGAVWLSIISSAPGKQGHVSGAEANKLTEERDAAPSKVLLDPEGDVGRLYGAKTTPHMFVIDNDGIVRYAGAIDDTPTANEADLETAQNLVLAAFDDMDQGQSVAVPYETPYGCTVKY